MKKSDQIKALQAECDQLTKERDALRSEAVRLARECIDLRRRQAPPSLADQARSEFYRKWDWLLEAVGF